MTISGYQTKSHRTRSQFSPWTGSYIRLRCHSKSFNLDRTIFQVRASWIKLRNVGKNEICCKCPLKKLTHHSPLNIYVIGLLQLIATSRESCHQFSSHKILPPATNQNLRSLMYDFHLEVCFSLLNHDGWFPNWQHVSNKRRNKNCKVPGVRKKVPPFGQLWL